MKVFYGLFKKASDVFEQFETEPTEAIFLYAQYDYEDYSGYAFVVYTLDGKLYEVSGCHCSCNGLEGCWEPEETTIAALLARPGVPKKCKVNLVAFA